MNAPCSTTSDPPREKIIFFGAGGTPPTLDHWSWRRLRYRQRVGAAAYTRNQAAFLFRGRLLDRLSGVIDSAPVDRSGMKWSATAGPGIAADVLRSVPARDRRQGAHQPPRALS